MSLSEMKGVESRANTKEKWVDTKGGYKKERSKRPVLHAVHGLAAIGLRSALMRIFLAAATKMKMDIILGQGKFMDST